MLRNWIRNLLGKEKEEEELTEEELNESEPLFHGLQDVDAAGEAIEKFEEAERLVSSASTFEELFQALRTIGEVEGSKQTYSPKDLITIINHVRNKKLTPGSITRTYGLREKVIQLFAAERG